VSYPRKDVLKMQSLLAEAKKLAAGDPVVSTRIEWYGREFKQFFKESEENESGAAFAPFTLKKAVAEPTVDGKLDESCWPDAPAAKFVSAWNKTNSVPQYGSVVRAVWYPERGVTFGFDFDEPAVDKMKQGAAGDGWGQDNIEVFIDASGSGEGHYYQIIVDGTGRVDYSSDGKKWKPTTLKAAVATRKGGWTMELFVPFAELKNFPKLQLPTTAANGVTWFGTMSRWRVGDGSRTEMSRLYTRYSAWNMDPAALGKFMFVE